MLLGELENSKPDERIKLTINGAFYEEESLDDIQNVLNDWLKNKIFSLKEAIDKPLDKKEVEETVSVYSESLILRVKNHFISGKEKVTIVSNEFGENVEFIFTKI